MKICKAAILATILVYSNVGFVSAQQYQLPQILNNPQAQNLIQERVLQEEERTQQQLLQNSPDLLKKLQQNKETNQQFNVELGQIRQQIYQKYQQQVIQLWQTSQNDLVQSTQATINKYRQLLLK